MTVVDGVRLVSNSELQTHSDCPRKWWLAWHRGLRPAHVSFASAAAIGGRYHEALAAIYDVEPSDPLRALATAQERDRHLHALARQDVYTEEELSDWTFEDDKLTKAFALETAMVTGYVRWLEDTGADAHLEIVGSELYVEVDFFELGGVIPNWDDLPIKLIGRLDARVLNLLNNSIMFIDHKSVGTFIDLTLYLNQQMLHYHLIQRHLSRAAGQPRPIGAIYNMARKVLRTRASKPPYYERRTITHSDIEIDNYRQQVAGRISRIIDAERDLSRGEDHHFVVPARPSRDCSWKCPFLKVCRMHDDGSRVEAAVEDLYQVGNPLSYYGGREKGGEEVA